jgi:hypothetical protein
MLANFERIGIRFQYPDNWVLDSETASAGGREVTVYSPGGAYWSVILYEKDSNPEQILDQIVASLKQEYQDLDHELLADDDFEEENLACEINFIYLDLTNTVVARVFPGIWANYLVMFQAEDRDLRNIGPVFQAMTISLLRESNLRGAQFHDTATISDETEEDHA